VHRDGPQQHVPPAAEHRVDDDVVYLQRCRRTGQRLEGLVEEGVGKV
jgi:hypothetical protein